MPRRSVRPRPLPLCGSATLVVFTLGWWLLGRPARPKQLNSAQWLDAIKVGLALVAGLGAAVGLTVSYRRQRTEEARHQVEQAKELGDRYTGAFAPPCPDTVTVSATSRASPARCANATTGASPAHHTRFASSKTAETLQES